LIKHREFAPYDKAANARMDQAFYHWRSLVETVISVLKHKQVRGRSEQPGLVATVSGAGRPMPGLQRGASGEAGSDPP